MDNTVVWSKEASDRVTEILSYLGKNWTEKEKNVLLNQLGNFEKRVIRYPKLYPYSTGKPTLRKAVLSKFTTVIYEEYDESINIVTVFDSRQNEDY